MHHTDILDIKDGEPPDVHTYSRSIPKHKTLRHTLFGIKIEKYYVHSSSLESIFGLHCWCEGVWFNDSHDQTILTGL